MLILVALWASQMFSQGVISKGLTFLEKPRIQ